MKDWILQKFAFYASATAAERRAISDAAVGVHLPAGTTFYRESDEIDHVALVGHGDIRVFKTVATGREVTLYDVRDGQACLVTVLAAVLRRPAMASAVVEKPTYAVLIAADVFRKLLTTNGALQPLVFEAAASRVADMMTLVEEIAVGKMDVQLATWLLRQFAQHPPRAAITATPEDIARDLGTATDVVSRLLDDFERKCAVRLLNGRVMLSDRRVLAAIAMGTELFADVHVAHDHTDCIEVSCSLTH